MSQHIKTGHLRYYHSKFIDDEYKPNDHLTSSSSRGFIVEEMERLLFCPVQ